MIAGISRQLPTACLMLSLSIWVSTANFAEATPAGFLKATIPLNAPPVGLAFDFNGTLYALEGAPFGSNQATLREILPDSSFGSSFPVVGDDPNNFFVGSMIYDPLEDRLLIADNTADGRIYAVDKLGNQTTLAADIPAIAGIAVRSSGEIFVSTALGDNLGAVFQIDRSTGEKTPVLSGIDYGAGLAFDAAENLIVQDADASTFLGRLQLVPITETLSGLEFGAAVPVISDMQSSAGVMIDGENDIFTTGVGGLFQVDGSPLAETSFDTNGNPFQFATAIAFDPGSLPFEGFSGTDGGRLAYMADFGFMMQDALVTLLTPTVPGDYNTDGAVDEGDFELWKLTYGSTTLLNADGNGEGRIGAGDFTIWRDNLGATHPWMASGEGAGNAVPEPSAFIGALLIVACLTIGNGRMRFAHWRHRS